MVTAQHVGELGKRDVLLRLDRGQDYIAKRLDPIRANVPVHRQGRRTAFLPPGSKPANRGGHADPEPLSRRTPGRAAVHRGYDTQPKILTKRCCHACWPPFQQTG